MFLVALLCPQPSSADGFTGQDFDGWSAASQDSYIQTSVTMAGVVFTRTHGPVARCINDWYFKDGAKAARNDEIRTTVTAYGEHHPAGVILAVILQACPMN